LLLQVFLDTFHRINHILAMAEGRQPEISFPARPPFEERMPSPEFLLRR
jgi:hypothetical protein